MRTIDTEESISQTTENRRTGHTADKDLCDQKEELAIGIVSSATEPINQFISSSMLCMQNNTPPLGFEIKV